MERCYFSVNAQGAFNHPLGDQTPVDCRYGEFLDTVDLPHKHLLRVAMETVLGFGGLVNPRAVIVWNVSGQGLQIRPTDEEAAAIARQVLLVGLIGSDGPSASPGGWQSLRPAAAGDLQGGSTILWLAPGTRVVLRPAEVDTAVLARILVLPGQ